MIKLLKKFSWYVIAIAIVAMIVFAFIPKPVEVDTTRVERGLMRVTVDQDGKTRVKERYIIAAPLMGRLIRVNLKAGDPVEAGKTVVAAIVPTPPELLDARAREETEARVRAAEATLLQAAPAIERAIAQRDRAIGELERAKRMSVDSVMSNEELEDKTLAVAVREADVKSMTFARDVARFQLEQARAALARTSVRATANSSSPTTNPTTDDAPPSAGSDSIFQIISPVNGYVLRVWQESEAPVNPGTQLLEVGDINDLEAVIDVLSRDAVNVRAGAPVLLERWGGGDALRGAVRRVEPSGFTKISALGVEEQRVNVIVDFTEDLKARQTLSDGYRVDARIIVWEKPDVLKAPMGSLFRNGTEWSVFIIDAGKAIERKLKLGRMNAEDAEVLEGLSDRDVVIMHPSDKIKNDVAVVERKR
ncbi:MAG: HlyD family efflux transporter periplasmic adaptor subunit [Anaerolineae bacterium]|nr:HlyD family efflux transporter periplasmic adaptor subunit [Phycisphaerae bacterium]